MPVPHPRFSVIIPTLQEENYIETAIRSARAAYGEDCEIIVVDGGSTDRTPELAARHGRLIRQSGGRGAQLNAGAARAAGGVLVFLHADTTVEAASGGEITRALRDGRVIGGCHRFRFAQPSAGLRFGLLQAAVNIRTRLFRTATGDQALFARREAFAAVGGYPDDPLFEDVALVRRLRKVGRFEVLGSAACTSRRRWETRGFVRTVVLHWVLRAAFHVGVSPRLLGAWYAGRRGVRSALADESVDA